MIASPTWFMMIARHRSLEAIRIMSAGRKNVLWTIIKRLSCLIYMWFLIGLDWSRLTAIRRACSLPVTLSQPFNEIISSSPRWTFPLDFDCAFLKILPSASPIWSTFPRTRSTTCWNRALDTKSQWANNELKIHKTKNSSRNFRFFTVRLTPFFVVEINVCRFLCSPLSKHTKSIFTIGESAKRIIKSSPSANRAWNIFSQAS